MERKRKEERKEKSGKERKKQKGGKKREKEGRKTENEKKDGKKERKTEKTLYRAHSIHIHKKDHDQTNHAFQFPKRTKIVSILASMVRRTEVEVVWNEGEEASSSSSSSSSSPSSPADETLNFNLNLIEMFQHHSYISSILSTQTYIHSPSIDIDIYNIGKERGNGNCIAIHLLYFESGRIECRIGSNRNVVSRLLALIQRFVQHNFYYALYMIIG